MPSDYLDGVSAFTDSPSGPLPPVGGAPTGALPAAGMVPSVPFGGAVIGMDAAPAGLCPGVTSAPAVTGVRPSSRSGSGGGGGGTTLAPGPAPGLESCPAACSVASIKRSAVAIFVKPIPIEVE